MGFAVFVFVFFPSDIGLMHLHGAIPTIDSTVHVNAACFRKLFKRLLVTLLRHHCWPDEYGDTGHTLCTMNSKPR